MGERSLTPVLNYTARKLRHASAYTYTTGTDDGSCTLDDDRHDQATRRDTAPDPGISDEQWQSILRSYDDGVPYDEYDDGDWTEGENEEWEENEAHDQEKQTIEAIRRMTRTHHEETPKDSPVDGALSETDEVTTNSADSENWSDSSSSNEGDETTEEDEEVVPLVPLFQLQASPQRSTMVAGRCVVPKVSGVPMQKDDGETKKPAAQLSDESAEYCHFCRRERFSAKVQSSGATQTPVHTQTTQTNMQTSSTQTQTIIHYVLVPQLLWNFFTGLTVTLVPIFWLSLI